MQFGRVNSVHQIGAKLVADNFTELLLELIVACATLPSHNRRLNLIVTSSPVIGDVCVRSPKMGAF